MNIIAFFGAIELGLLYALVGIGVYLSFRVLDFPDLTVDGSFPLGGAVAATLIANGIDPYLATGVAIFAGGIAGLITAFLNVQFKILHLLASILTAIALYSINLRIMGKPNVSLLGQSTAIAPLEELLNFMPSWVATPLILLILVLLIKFCLDYFLNSELGLAMRATGTNPTMAKAQGIYTDRLILLGIVMSNALVAFAGALFAQLYGFADVTMGMGTIIFGLAAVIIGERLITNSSVQWATFSAILGAISYRIAVAFAFNLDFLGFQTQDLNLVTAILVGIALISPKSLPKKLSSK
ncbi:ABC transporter permease [Spirulina sp. 06S082]|uniref:ABC transporter permease n=1 Tax=Spirulina sp. 06S082 TaxID=3110248 RepID=UPI002B216592|nr:ABC transporter permease [Spirulina sp. 06S082]MEA5467797.1 ABC transporter permease [Spirulina sp. 06S082]